MSCIVFGRAGNMFPRPARLEAKRLGDRGPIELMFGSLRPERQSRYANADSIGGRCSDTLPLTH